MKFFGFRLVYIISDGDIVMESIQGVIDFCLVNVLLEYRNIRILVNIERKIIVKLWSFF